LTFITVRGQPSALLPEINSLADVLLKRTNVMSAPNLKEVSDSAASAIGTAAGTVRDYAKQASEGVQQTAKQAAGQMRTGYDEAERFVQNRPAESVLVCFGVGLIVGVVIALSLHSR
jgi:ElaB/YqjD/DUF883 family membrane-anchored ribosome-binding protein